MNVINMPGFAAEATLYGTNGHRRMVDTAVQGRTIVNPAQFLIPRNCVLDCIHDDCDPIGDKTGREFGDCVRQCHCECNPSSCLPPTGRCAPGLTPFNVCCPPGLMPGCVQVP